MADALYQKLLKLRDASFDLSSKSRLLHVAPRAKYQTPLLAEDGIPEKDPAVCRCFLKNIWDILNSRKESAPMILSVPEPYSTV